MTYRQGGSVIQWNCKGTSSLWSKLMHTTLVSMNRFLFWLVGLSLNHNFTLSFILNIVNYCLCDCLFQTTMTSVRV